jgi:beta-glucanase (GH16 family)
VLLALIVSWVTLVAGGCTAPPAPPSGPPTPPAGWRLTFDDEFDGAAGTPPQPQRWLHDTGGTGWGDNQLQYYTDSAANAQLDGTGHLALTARREASGLTCWYGPCGYSSAKITTRQPQLALFAQGYGQFEARAKVPVGKGLWPAFWLVGENLTWAGTAKAGEIDVMETLGDRPGQVEQHAHGPGLDFGGPAVLPSGQSVADWHTYAVHWTPDRIDWQIDGRITRSLTKDQAGDAGWVFDHPFYILLNLAVGGGWPGAPDDRTAFPATMLVDYVRVYTTKEQPINAPPEVAEGE